MSFEVNYGRWCIAEMKFRDRQSNLGFDRGTSQLNVLESNIWRVCGSPCFRLQVAIFYLQWGNSREGILKKSCKYIILESNMPFESVYHVKRIQLLE